MLSVVSLVHSTPRAEALHLALQTRVPVWNCCAWHLRLAGCVQKCCTQHFDLECCEQHSCADPQELQSPPRWQEPYKAALPMVFEREHGLYSASSHISILWSKNKAFLCFLTKLSLTVLVWVTLGRRTLLEEPGRVDKFLVTQMGLIVALPPGPTTRLWTH